MVVPPGYNSTVLQIKAEPTSSFRSRLARFLTFVGAMTMLVMAGTIVYCSVGPEPKPRPAIVGPAPVWAAAPGTSDELYLDLLKKSLTRYLHPELHKTISYADARQLPLIWLYYIKRMLATIGLDVVVVQSFNPQARAEGRDPSRDLDTMIGLKRLDNLQFCVTDVLKRKVPGDLIEAGAWRGGATVFMRAVLKVYGDPDRKVWVSDSFEGLPPPDPVHFPADAGLWEAGADAISIEEARSNFARYGMLDDRVVFLKGFFKDTLPKAPIERLAILRIDADMYQSTTEALTYLYPKLSPGGYLIVDDYGAFEACKKAVHDYRKAQGITEEIQQIDWTGIFWQKQR